MIVLGDIRHGYMIGRAAHTSFDPQLDHVISRCAGDGRFLGGVIFTNYTGSMVMMHMAGVGLWASPELAWVCFDYPFMQLQVKKIMATVRSDNERAVAACKGFGWTLEHEIEHGIPGGTLRIYSMLREGCRWLRLRSRYMKPVGDPINVHLGPHSLERRPSPSRLYGQRRLDRLTGSS